MSFPQKDSQMFNPVTKPNFPETEEKILAFWKDRQIFDKSVSNRKGGPGFKLYEGPPTANGKPGIHHVLSRAFKDVMPRYKTMRGYHAPRKGGWDTHGLPVELEIEKKLGLHNKPDIEKFGVAEFNARCRESVMGYLKDWEAMTERIGYWVDLEHAYKTLDNTYIESDWWAIKQLWDKGVVYQGYRVTPHCPRCGTSLSSHEVALGYKDATDPSVFIKFQLDRGKSRMSAEAARLFPVDVPVYFLVWTTTPWTLPGNTAIAVAPDIEYAVVEIEESGSKHRLVLAQALLGGTITGPHSIAGTIKGRDLAGCVYVPLFPPAEFGVKVEQFGDKGIAAVTEMPRNYPVILGEFVSMDEGTGIVHVAPAFGEVDFEAGEKNHLYFIQQVDLEGKLIGKYQFAGKFVKTADPEILSNLTSRGLLYRSERVTHTYPFCWRCDTPLLYYAKRTWYIRTTAFKKALIDGNAKINWYPEHIKYGRFGDWLENNVDWAFSRERYWGTPLNVWHCPACESQTCVGSVKELGSMAGLKGFEPGMDLHRPFVDRVTFGCAKCGGRMERQAEVIDCWFDSGAMPFAQWHYPFENQDKFSPANPAADFICEAIDQTRGWFYSLHALSTMLFGLPSFNNVICLGHILDAEGEKMSKAKGNVVEPGKIINKYGADAVRWYLYTSSPPGNVRRFSEDLVAEVMRNFLLTLWNTYSFFVMYANIDNYDPKAVQKAVLSDMDRWILAELHQLVEHVTQSMDNYDPTGAARRMAEFVSDLSNWYIRRSRRRFWKSESDADKAAAYATLYECLITVSKLLAPFVPFVAEELYLNLSKPAGGPESVHLADFPVADTAKIDAQLISDVKWIVRVASLGRAARSKAAIKVRQPLSEIIVRVKSESQRKALSVFADQIQEEVNVKVISTSDQSAPVEKPGFVTAVEGDEWVAVNTELTAELAGEGAAREIVRRIQTMRRSAGFNVADHIRTCYVGDTLDPVLAVFGEYIKHETLSTELVKASPAEGVYSETFSIEGNKVTFGVQVAG